MVQYGAGVTRNLDCPKEMVGRVIGKGGETIKAMQREFQANIQIDQTSLPMKITISGQPASVERAYAVVAEIVAGGNPYIGGSVGHAGALSIIVLQYTMLVHPMQCLLSWAPANCALAALSFGAEPVAM